MRHSSHSSPSSRRNESTEPAIQRFKVTLDLERIQSSLSEADQCEYTPAEVRQWLVDAGFSPYGNRWIVAGANLGELQPAEVVSITPLVERRSA